MGEKLKSFLNNLLGIIGIILIAAVFVGGIVAVVLGGKYFLNVENSPEILNSYHSCGIDFITSRTWAISENIFNSNILLGEKIKIILSILGIVGIAILVPDCLNPIFQLIPILNPSKDIHFQCPAILRLLPGIVVGVSTLVCMFMPVDLPAVTWIKRITVVLTVLSLLFLLFAAFANSGLFGTIYQAPIIIASNIAAVIAVDLAFCFGIILIALVISAVILWFVIRVLVVKLLIYII